MTTSHELVFSFRDPTNVTPRSVAKLEAIARTLFGDSNTIIDTTGLRSWAGNDQDISGDIAQWYLDNLTDTREGGHEGKFDLHSTRLSTFIFDE
jgi:hypothetical protein